MVTLTVILDSWQELEKEFPDYERATIETDFIFEDGYFLWTTDEGWDVCYPLHRIREVRLKDE